MSFAARTVEEQGAILKKARQARAAKNAARARSSLRRDFANALLWQDLAHDRGLRLPPWGEPPTVRNMRTFLHKVSLSQADWESEWGCKLADFPRLNPDWPIRAFAGLILEQQQERRANQA